MPRSREETLTAQQGWPEPSSPSSAPCLGPSPPPRSFARPSRTPSPAGRRPRWPGKPALEVLEGRRRGPVRIHTCGLTDGEQARVLEALSSFLEVRHLRDDGRPP